MNQDFKVYLRLVSLFKTLLGRGLISSYRVRYELGDERFLLLSSLNLLLMQFKVPVSGSRLVPLLIILLILPWPWPI